MSMNDSVGMVYGLTFKMIRNKRTGRFHLVSAWFISTLVDQSDAFTFLMRTTDDGTKEANGNKEGMDDFHKC